MKPMTRTLIAASLLLSLSGLSLAQTAPDHKGHAPRADRMEKKHAKHLAELKGKLKLESSQEAVWATFEQSMQVASPSVAHPDRATLEKMTTPERLDQMEAHKAQRDAQMKKHVDATKTFYAALNSTQKKVFDTETARAMSNMMKGGMKKGGMHGGHEGHNKHSQH
jgi:Spy/CpxP family protein refolding chaperone